ncbi:SURF1 family protein [Planctomonas psychrotolerans]|uniref:SURF1 family protein n=1 Tax=Planctomonas psychrotolerans TaxID=2528712 RepID=UPI0012387B40|nr:SURF1 family protein [Planctomonas psychrotolerans]
MLDIMRRPKWIGLLVLALAIAAGFALLGQWQLARAVESGVVLERATEEAIPLPEVVQPQQPVPEASSGQRVSVTGIWQPGDYELVADRVNGGADGFWVVGHLAVTTDGETVADNAPGLAVALGWTADRADALAAADTAARTAPTQPVSITGRFLPSEAPELPDESGDPDEMTTLSVAALINRWEDFGNTDAYSGFVVADEAPAPLQVIDSPAPSTAIQLNWLNIFYAAEWVIFAGFAVFIWFRLVRDQLERETEEAEEAEEAAKLAASGSR